MKAFLTGSYVYGSPTKHSDVDLVIRVDQETFDQLIDLSDAGKLPVKFSDLNLILAETDDKYNAWLYAKEKCVERMAALKRKLTKDEAIEIHETVRAFFNVPYGSESKGDSGYTDEPGNKV